MAIWKNVLVCSCGKEYLVCDEYTLLEENVIYQAWTIQDASDKTIILQRLVACSNCKQPFIQQTKKQIICPSEDGNSIQTIDCLIENKILTEIDYTWLKKAFIKKDAKSCLSSKILNFQTMIQKILDQNIDGDIAECGVYRGGTSRFLSTMFENKKIYLFDSFEGMKEDDAHQDGHHKKNDFNQTSLKEVQEYLADKTNCIFCPGWIPESATFLNEESFCLVFLDMDLYQSTKHGIEIFWDRLNRGGMMVFDDYNNTATPGVNQAINEFFTEKIPHRKTISNFLCGIEKL